MKQLPYSQQMSLDSLQGNYPEQPKPEHIGIAAPGLGCPENRNLSNRTHANTTDPDSTLSYKKGATRRLKYKVHATFAIGTTGHTSIYNSKTGVWTPGPDLPL